MNEILRRAIAEAGFSIKTVADRIDVVPKTVQRWISGQALPYPRHRARLCALLGVDEEHLWPGVTSGYPLGRQPGSVDVLASYAHRWKVPREAWQALFTSAHHEIGILAYSALFLAEDAGIVRLLGDQARAGVKVRILLGDPESPHIAERGEDEGIGETMAAKIRNALVRCEPMLEVECVEIRLHRTVLYNSIYRADDYLMINPHIYGVPASNAPVLHIRTAEPGDMASTYVECFERIWADAVALA